MNDFWHSERANRPPETSDNNENSTQISDSYEQRKSNRDIGINRESDTNRVEKNSYKHWNSPEEQAENRRMVSNYDEKMSAVHTAEALTKSSVLDSQRERINDDNYHRIQRDIGSNKIEIYSDKNFESLLPEKVRQERIIGLREMKDGKICIRDCDDVEQLRHTGTHETMHDLSFQNEEHTVDTFPSDEGDLITVSETRQTSGIHIYENKTYMKNGEVKNVEEKQLNRYLNEGITEKKTLEEMWNRGEMPGMYSYCQEVNWAIELEQKVGKDIIDDAYYGGNIEQLKEKVDSMSDFENTWEDLNLNIDRYHYALDSDMKNYYRNSVNAILDELHDREKVLRKVR